MADITEYIEQIGEAVYGEEVRGAIMNSITEINNEVNKLAFTATLEAEDWAEDSDGYLTQTIENERISLSSTILISLHTDPTGLNLEAAADYANIYHAKVIDGGIKFYILGDPAEDIPINYLLLSSQSGEVFLTGTGVGGGSASGFQVRGISLVSEPNKLVYKRGESISSVGMSVRARYSNGSVADVTAQCTLSTRTAQSTAGEQEITVSYEEDGVTVQTAFYITVYALQSIAVTTQPTKKQYRRGETIDASGMAVTATYTNGATAVVTSECTVVTEEAPNTAGSHNVTVSYTEDGITKTTTYSITVYQISSIAITKQPNVKRYKGGATISTTGMEVTATYTNGATEVVTSQCSLSTTTASSTIGTQVITISFTDEDTVTTNLSVTIYALSSIAVTTQPTNTLYYPGDTINTAGMVVRATYTDGVTANVTGTTISPSTADNAVGSHNITVSYTESGVTKTTTFAITTRDLGESVVVTIAGLPSGKSAVVTVVDNTDPTITASETISQGASSTIVNIPNNHEYSINVSDVAKYATPTVITRTAVGNTTYSETITYTVAYGPLEDYTWAEISAIGLAGNAAKAFELGETKNFTINEDGNDVTYSAKIVDFNRKQSTDKSVVYGYVFQTTQCLNTPYENIYRWDRPLQGYQDFRTVLENIYTLIGSDLKNVIKYTEWKYQYGFSRGNTAIKDHSFNGHLSLPTRSNVGQRNSEDRFSYYPENIFQNSMSSDWIDDDSGIYKKTTQNDPNTYVTYYLGDFYELDSADDANRWKNWICSMRYRKLESGDEQARFNYFERVTLPSTADSASYSAYISFVFAV